MAAAGGGPGMVSCGGVLDGPKKVWHLHFWEVRIVEQLVMVQACHVEDDGFAVFSNLVWCIILP